MKIRKMFLRKKRPEYIKWKQEYKDVLKDERYLEWLISYAKKRKNKEYLIDLYDPNILPEEMEKVVLIPKFFKGIREYSRIGLMPAIITEYGIEYVLEYNGHFFLIGAAKVTEGTYYYFREVPHVKKAISFVKIIED